MRATEAALVAGAGALMVLRSPAARARAGQAAASAWRHAEPMRAAVTQQAGRRYEAVRARWADRSPAGPSPCVMADCDWTQDSPSAAALLEHIHTTHGGGQRKRSSDRAAGAPQRPAAAANKPSSQPVPVGPQERVEEVAPGVLIGRQIDQVIDKIGLHMDEFRAVTRALNAAGEVEPSGLLQLLEAMTGIQTTLASVANMITDLTEHADLNMWVDLRVLAPMYESASSVASETQTIRQAMGRLRELYAAQIEVEEQRESGEVRALNPKLAAA